MCMVCRQCWPHSNDELVTQAILAYLFLLQGRPQGELVAPLVHTDAVCAQHQAALLDACSSADACARQPAVDAW
jgi:hypothetical protein